MTSAALSLINPDPALVWEDKNARSIAFFCKSLPVHIDGTLIEELSILSEQRGGCNVRLCLHDSPEALHHDMIILEHKGQYSRPHKHINAGETFNVIDGKMAVFIFSDTGDVLKTHTLNAGEIIRINTHTYHLLVPVSEKVIYHETKTGPFDRNNNVSADWAPDAGDTLLQEQYMRHLQNFSNQ